MATLNVVRGRVKSVAVGGVTAAEASDNANIHEDADGKSYAVKTGSEKTVATGDTAAAVTEAANVIEN